ncbi:MAG: sigma-70 family RNA polymerase sigma factor [Deltaproteobacteria bacterium]|nr:sigma-70 family RNA polymerase sigma factor [Deltaproteobacteria bacterium]
MALSAPERDALLQKHQGFVQKLARCVAREVPDWITVDELMSAGNEGLLKAAERYDPSRGASFTTWAYYRVRGSMLDFVRRVAAQDVRCRVRVSAQAAVDDLIEATLGSRPRTASDPRADAANALASTLEEMALAFTMAEFAEVLAPKAPAPDPETAAALREGMEQARAVIAKLPERERAMVDGVYFHHLTIEETGARLGLSKGWASRLHARALKLLREGLGAR